MKVVIIGAGKTGRGFIAPIMQGNGMKITFVDKDEKLIRDLNSLTQYKVSYFDDKVLPKVIQDFDAFHINDSNSLRAVSEADIVTTSVFANQIESLIPFIEEAIEMREREEKLLIICIENGINVKQPLIDANLNAVITEGIIFCTSLNIENSLDIISEAGIDLPIDSVPLDRPLTIEGMPLEEKFQDLIQRKIYTYNFISAIIAYLGSYKQYDSYAVSAKDKVISHIIERFLKIHNKLMAEKYNIALEEQVKFSRQAVSKFSNEAIPDSISRNAQQVKRKLGKKERLMQPLLMAIANGETYNLYLLVIAAAIFYGNRHEDLEPKSSAEEIEIQIGQPGIANKIMNLYAQFEYGNELSDIMEDIQA